jgi:CheY-like chemotaxis protein
MPEFDGYDFIERLRELDAARGGATPAIALTAFARDEDRERTLAAGYQLHLAKPVEPHELLTAVARLVGRDPAR